MLSGFIFMSFSHPLQILRIYHVLWRGLSQVIYLSWEEGNETALASGKLQRQPTGCQCCHVLCWELINGSTEQNSFEVC